MTVVAIGDHLKCDKHLRLVDKLEKENKQINNLEVKETIEANKNELNEVIINSKKKYQKNMMKIMILII